LKFVNKPVVIVGFLTFNSLLAFFTSKVKGNGIGLHPGLVVKKTVVFLTASAKAVIPFKPSPP
jgi:hypothetical protein